MSTAAVWPVYSSLYTNLKASPHSQALRSLGAIVVTLMARSRQADRIGAQTDPWLRGFVVHCHRWLSGPDGRVTDDWAVHRAEPSTAAWSKRDSGQFHATC